ncbi:hypothetical protein [Cellulomonas pakistanensis]|uniref:Uncharacterized protein n=1 Tax=Cellulomonas pakistanensis TaxID=992287 RepID=A0A919PEB6_9CELL|nr:hypothetical protein [Cellulomonas pakistanensis]GIG37027.1 hypothetical protein Cpa01nite_24080 [Cellulomonas pakistanensis]
MSRTPAEHPTTAEQRRRGSRAALWGTLGAVVAGLAAVGTVIALAVR